MLEKNWQGPLRRNEQVEQTFRHFEALEQDASPQEKQNWRFQQALYRAYYDAYLRRRLIYESELEELARAELRDATNAGSLAAVAGAERLLGRAGRSEEHTSELQSR